MTKSQRRSVAFSVEEWQWNELDERTEDRSSRHPVHQGVNISVQLHIWPNLIQRAWNNARPENLKELSEFGVTEIPADPCVIALKEDSSLCLISGISQKIKRLTWRTDSRKQTIDTLLDCGIPIVLSENVTTNDPSEYVKEAEHLLAVCFLWGGPYTFNKPLQQPDSVQSQDDP